MRITTFLSCAFWIVISSFTVIAQSDFLTIGTIVESSIEAGQDQSFKITLLETSIVSIHVEALSDQLDPTVELRDSSGNIIIENDDLNHPDVSDALIQAFVVPRTDTYTIAVGAFGETSGAFRLTILPGYDQLAIEDSINNESNWELVTETNTIMTPINGGLFIETEGISKTATILANHFPQADDFYFEASFTEIMASTNWQVGIVFRYISPSRYYRLIMNNQGFWQLELVHDEDITVLQSWSTHPAIIPGETAFTLGILTSGESIDIVYNHQFIGTVYDNQIMEAGSVGITAITANALDSRVVFTLDHALMTQPSQIGDNLVFPEVLAASNYVSLARTLERQQIIATGGEVKFTVPEIQIHDIDPGVSRFPVASNVVFSEFVMGGTVSWTTSGEGIGGCGITFNDTGEQNYTLAYLTTNGEYGVSKRSGDSFEVGIYGQGLAEAAVSYNFTLIIHDSLIQLYMNNRHVGKMPYSPTSGEISTAVVNFDGVDTTCVFKDLWLWSLDETSS